LDNASHRKNRLISSLLAFATVLALVVVILGAYTRLSDAGLGCPDWPGCYGQISVPSSSASVDMAKAAFPGYVIEPVKAWKEMIHRYVAGTLGLLILLITALAVWRQRDKPYFVTASLGLLGLVIFQAALGMWTVTLKLLPIVVMGHLMGGLTLLAGLRWLNLRMNGRFQLEDNHSQIRPWAILALIVVILQIALGGWTSANYASIVCPDFPSCHGNLWPAMDFQKGFNLFAPIGANFEGGVLEHPARVAIQMVHRMGALFTTIFLFVLAYYLFKETQSKLLRWIGVEIVFLLMIQILLGILNVVLILPLPIAVMHNGVAALLLLSLVTLNNSLYGRKEILVND